MLGGLGNSTILVGSDEIDSKTATGLYIGNSVPFTGYESALLVLNSGRGRITQIAVSCGTQNVRIMIRSYNYTAQTATGYWTSWREITTTAL